MKNNELYDLDLDFNNSRIAYYYGDKSGGYYNGYVIKMISINFTI